MPASRGFLEEIGADMNSGDWWNLPRYKGVVCLREGVSDRENNMCQGWSH